MKLTNSDRGLFIVLTLFVALIYVAAVAACLFRHAGHREQPTSCIFVPRSQQ